MTDLLLSVRGLRAAYGPIEVLHGIDLDVPTGSVVAVLGPNGAGKTTLLSVLAGLHPATAGSVVLAGRRVNGARADDLARAGLCLVPEGRGIFPNLTVHEHLRMVTHSGPPPRRHRGRRPTPGSPGSPSAAARWPGRCPAASSRCSPWLAGSPPSRRSCCSTSCRWGWRPLIVEELYAQVAAIAASGVSIVVVEQFARTVLGVADLAAVLVHGRIGAAGAPDDIEADLEPRLPRQTVATGDLP